MHFSQQLLSTESGTLDKQTAHEQIESAYVLYLIFTVK